MGVLVTCNSTDIFETSLPCLLNAEWESRKPQSTTSSPILVCGWVAHLLTPTHSMPNRAEQKSLLFQTPSHCSFFFGSNWVPPSPTTKQPHASKPYAIAILSYMEYKKFLSPRHPSTTLPSSCLILSFCHKYVQNHKQGANYHSTHIVPSNQTIILAIKLAIMEINFSIDY